MPIVIARHLALLSLMVLVVVPEVALAQFGPSRAINNAIDMNTNKAMERVQLSLAIKNNSGKVVVQKISRDGRYLLLVFEDNRPRIWDLEKSRYWDNFEALGVDIVAGAMGSGMSFVTVQSDGTIATWNAASNQPAKIRAIGISDIRDAETGRTGTLALVDSSGAVYVSDGAIRKIGDAVPLANQDKYQLVVDPSGDFLAAAQIQGAVQIWDIRSGAKVASAVIDAPVSAIAFGSEASQLFIATNAGVVDWDLNRSRAAGQYKCSGQCMIKDVLLNEASRSLVALSGDGELISWPLDRYRASPSVQNTAAQVEKISTSAMAPLVIMGIGDGIVRFSRLEGSEDTLSLASTTRGWALIDDKGRFDGTMGSDSGVFWENDALSLPIASFLDTHFEPGLFAKWLGVTDEPFLTDPRAIADGVLAPPSIEVSAMQVSPADANDEVEVVVQVTDQGGGIGSPSLYHLGLRVSPEKLVDTNKTELGGKDSRIYRYRLRALPGENTFTARVRDDEGVDSPGRSVSLMVDSERLDPELHIVTIAIDDYGSQGLNLNYSIADATGLIENLSSLADPLFAGVQTTSIHNSAATRRGVLDGLRGLRSAGPDDVIVIYVATHGDVIDKKFHLLLQGLQLPLAKPSLGRVAVSFDEIAREIEMLDARRVLLLLDTCKSGDALAQLETDFADRRALQSFGNLLGVHMIAATAKGQFASESKVLGHGIFTYSIIQSLQGGADLAPVDGLLTATELASSAANDVPALSAQYARYPQWPTVYSRGFDFSVASSSPR